jgi:hypothetical protein
MLWVEYPRRSRPAIVATIFTQIAIASGGTCPIPIVSSEVVASPVVPVSGWAPAQVTHTNCDDHAV